MAITVLHIPRDIDTEDRLSLSLSITDPAPAIAVARRLLAGRRYRPVAEVEGQDIQRAYLLTQNIDGPNWAILPPEGVRPLGEIPKDGIGRLTGYKSSEPGDIFIKDGRAYLAHPTGALDLGEAPEEAIA